MKILYLILFLPVILMAQDIPLFKKNPLFDQQIALYEIYKTEHADVVMLGNSITHGTNWNALLNRQNISEQGIPSDILEGYLNRLKYVTKLKPKLCFIMGGINDIYNATPVESIFEMYKRVLLELRNNNIIPVLQLTLYVSPKWPAYDVKNPEVTRLNRMLKQYAIEQNIEFIDLNKKFSLNNTMLGDYTIDGVHLSAKAYKLWAIEVEKVLNKYHL